MSTNTEKESIELLRKLYKALLYGHCLHPACTEEAFVNTALIETMIYINEHYKEYYTKTIGGDLS